MFIAVASSIGVYWQSRIIAEHHRNYILREGMWTMMEQERTFLNLRDLAIRISLNDFIPAQTYLDYRATAFFRAGVNYRFATNNPNFSDEERALLSQIDQNLQVYTSIDNGALPDQA